MKPSRMALSATLLAATLVAGSAFADDSGYGAAQSQTRNSDFNEAAELIGAKRYASAIPLLVTVTKAEPDNADAYNLLGFSYRKSGNLERADEAYRRALALDPGHLNALEYQGELFLMRNDVDAALANLDKISGQCLFTCEQERELQAAIEKWRGEQGG